MWNEDAGYEDRCSTCLFEDEYVLAEKLFKDQRNHHHYHHYYYYYHHHFTLKEKTQKIECICAVHTYVAKSKLPIELNILHTNASETS